NFLKNQIDLRNQLIRSKHIKSATNLSHQKVISKLTKKSSSEHYLHIPNEKVYYNEMNNNSEYNYRHENLCLKEKISQSHNYQPYYQTTYFQKPNEETSPISSPMRQLSHSSSARHLLIKS